MSIHQVSVAYQADHDRLLVRVRTRDDQLFEFWLTRRLMIRLWQPLQNTASSVALGGVSSGTTVLPEAREMMAQTLREKSRQSADFSSPFEESARERPLGEEPMLVAEVDLKRHSNQKVDVTLRDSKQRSVTLNLGPELLSNLLTLLERSLEKSEWGLLQPQSHATAHAGEAPATNRVLN